VHPFGGYEGFFAEFVAVRVSEDNTGEWGATESWALLGKIRAGVHFLGDVPAWVMYDVSDNASDVPFSLCKVERS
jgi:hypothetical protein